MRLFLLSLSLLLTALCATAQSAADRHSFQVQMGAGSLSGILLMRADSTAVTGSMINEFGISAVNFTYRLPRHDVKLLSVIGFLDKWYIRRVLRRDLALCVELLRGLPASKSRGNYTITLSGDTTTVTNRRRHITYKFAPLNTPHSNDASE